MTECKRFCPAVLAVAWLFLNLAFVVPSRAVFALKFIQGCPSDIGAEV